jgi:hypothetical protein
VDFQKRAVFDDAYRGVGSFQKPAGNPRAVSIPFWSGFLLLMTMNHNL